MDLKDLWLQLLWMLPFLQKGETQLVRCDMPADVVFLLDASASIMPNEWQQEKEFVGILIDSLAVEQHAIHVGLIVYSTEIGQVVDLQPFKTRAQLKAELPKLVQTNQGTDTARAISRMRQMMENQARDNAKKIAVVITDGRSENPTATIQEAVYARQLDRIMMIALGVGNETYIDELLEIAKSDFYPDQNRLFTVREFSQLQGVVEELRNLICEAVPDSTTVTRATKPTTATTTPSITLPVFPPIACPRPADVIFLLDGSHSITDEDWARGRVFVSTLLNSMEVDQDSIHVGIIVYSSDIGDTVPLKPFLGKEVLKTKAAGLNQPPLGRTNTALGIRALRAMFTQQGRTGVPHIGMVITDGKSSSVQATMGEAFRAKSEDGVVMVVVGVGQDTLATELEAMATSPSTLFKVSDYTSLLGIVEELRERICNATDSTTTSSTAPTTSTPTTTPSIPPFCQECLIEGGVGYNTYPPDCTKYAVCYPEESGGFRAEIKDCPFGLFWSSSAVACIDATYVTCTADPCHGQSDGWGHASGTRGCGEYWTCLAGRSQPHCCPPGERYSSIRGCVRDVSCQDQCSLQWTLAGNGACPNRPDPTDPFGYLKIVPGSGHVKKPCSPGTAYNHAQCACVYYAPSLGCVPSLHFTFDGNFEDRSAHSHPSHIQRVLLTKQGSAYFNGSGLVRVSTLPGNEFLDKFVLRLRYRVQPERQSEIQWNDHYGWGMQDWFSSHNSTIHNLTLVGGQVPNTGPEPGLPSGQRTSTLEKVVVFHNGTVLHDATKTPENPWPGEESAGKFVSRVHLGPMRDIQETAVSGGVVYVPNNKGELLVFSPNTAPGEASSWQIVAKNGTVMQSGTGEVAPSVSEAFNFRLKPAPTARWFIMTDTGTVLNSGTGSIPEAVRKLYAGFTAGRLLKVDQLGEEVVDWSVSRPDGSGERRGNGSVPAELVQQLKLDEVLRPEGAIVRRWAVLSDNGEVLESGTGMVPEDILKKYSWLRSAMVLTHSDSIWQLQRPDGTKLMEGAGTLPSSVTRFIRSSVVLPSLLQMVTWSVTLPNGTRMTGKGSIPEEIQRLFDQNSVAINSGGGNNNKVSRWYVTDNEGTVLESGFGDVSQEIRKKNYRGDIKIVQQIVVQGSNLSRWQVLGPNGAVVASGDGQPPTELFKVIRAMPRGTPRFRAGDVPANLPPILNSPAHIPRHALGNNGRRLERKWTVTMANGSVVSGTGNIPASLEALLKSQQDAGMLSTRSSWSLTLPDGSSRSGVGAFPADIQALMTDGQSSRLERQQLMARGGPARLGEQTMSADPDAIGFLASGRSASGSLSRSRRAAGAMKSVEKAAGEVYQEVLGNCGGPPSPSFLLTTSEQNVRLTLKTTQQRQGATLILPIFPGMNDVQFLYDGTTFSGFANGIQKSLPLAGHILRAQAPVTIGTCDSGSRAFRGEIDEVSLSSCIS